MRPFDYKKAAQTFAKLPLQEIRQRKFMQFSDDLLLTIADEFFEEDRDRYIAIYEAVLHSIDHAYQFIHYSEIYAEVIGSNTPLRTQQDNIALAYAWLVYAARHGFLEEFQRAWKSLIYEFLTLGSKEGVVAGLQSLLRYLRSLDLGANEAYDLIEALFWRESTSEVGEKLVQRIIEFAKELDYSETVTYWQEALEIYRTNADEIEGENDSVQVDDRLLVDVGHWIVGLPLDQVEHEFFFLSCTAPVVGGPENGDAKTWSEEFASQAPWLLPELIHMALWSIGTEDANHDNSFPDWAVEVLQHFWQNQAAPMDELAPWLQKAHGNWRDYLSFEICKVGLLTPQELQEIAADTTVAISLRTKSIEALLDIVSRKPELRSEAEEFFRHLLTRPESREIYAEEELIASLIAIILDYPEFKSLLPEIEAAFRDDVVDIEVISVEDVELSWETALDVPGQEPPPEGREYLYLRCKKCGSTRLHAVKSVIIDSGTMDKLVQKEQPRYSPFIMDHEIVCPRCGSRDNYEVPELAKMKLLAQAMSDFDVPPDQDDFAAGLFRIFQERETSLEVTIAQMSDMEGREIHPLELRDEYLRRIKKNPQNVNHYIGLANIYKNLGWEEDVLKIMRRARKVAPHNLDVLLHLAMAEHDAGDKRVAEELYERILNETMSRGKSMPGSEEIEMAGIAYDGIRRLSKGKISPWAEGVRSSKPKPRKEKKRRFGLPRRKKKKKKKRKR